MISLLESFIASFTFDSLNKHMKAIFLLSRITLLLFLIFFACSKENENSFEIPDLTKCGCDFSYVPVCGDDGWNYLNTCYALCNKTTIQDKRLCESSYNPRDTMSWPIEAVCIPVVTEESPREVRALSDGTVLYRRNDGTLFRGGHNFCRCLPAATLISTSLGAHAVSELKVNDLVWSYNSNNEKILVPIKKMNIQAIPKGYQMIELLLSDGRKLTVSPLHPDRYGCPLDELQAGDFFNESKVISKSIVVYNKPYTYDLLPDSETRLYFANDILVGSTLMILDQKDTNYQ